MEHPPSWAIEAATYAARKSWCAKDQRGVVVYHEESGHEDFVAASNGPEAPFKCSGGDVCRQHCGQLAGHAEERALWLWAAEGRMRGMKLLHVKVDAEGHGVAGGPPRCVTCSRTMLMAGAAGIWLWLDAEHADGGEPAWRWYGAVEFHTLSLLHPRNNLPVIR